MSISEIAARYQVSESTARRRMRPVRDAVIEREANGTHWRMFWKTAAVVEAFRKAR